MSVPDNPEEILERDSKPLKAIAVELVIRFNALMLLAASIFHEYIPFIPDVIAEHYVTVGSFGVIFYFIAIQLYAHRTLEDSTTRKALLIESTIVLCMAINLIQAVGLVVIGKQPADLQLVIAITIFIGLGITDQLRRIDSTTETAT